MCVHVYAYIVYAFTHSHWHVCAYNFYIFYLLYRVGQHLGRWVCGLGAILITTLHVCVCVRERERERERERGTEREREREREKEV